MSVVYEWFISTFHGLPSELAALIISMVPLVELRGGIIFSKLVNLDLWKAALFCIIGNIIPIPFILLFIKQIFKWMKKNKFLGKIANWFEEKAMKKSDKFKNGEFVALILFVGIPLPGTGAWMGSLIASLLEMDIKKAIVAELIGLFMASAIMLTIFYAFPEVFTKLFHI